jgi:copper chaperone
MKKTIMIDGMSCQHCVMAVKKELQKLDLQNLDVKIGEATIEFDENKLNEQSIKAAIEEAGYAVVE